MPSRHKVTPLSIRLPDAERQRLYAHAGCLGEPVRQVILRAVRELLDREMQEAPPGEPDGGLNPLGLMTSPVQLTD